MEEFFYKRLSIEEKIAYWIKKEERSTHWLARKAGISQAQLYKMVFGPEKEKRDLTPKYIKKIQEVWPDADFSPPPEELLPHEEFEQMKINNPWKNNVPRDTHI